MPEPQSRNSLHPVALLVGGLCFALLITQQFLLSLETSYYSSGWPLVFNLVMGAVILFVVVAACAWWTRRKAFRGRLRLSTILILLAAANVLILFNFLPTPGVVLSHGTAYGFPFWIGHLDDHGTRIYWNLKELWINILPGLGMLTALGWALELRGRASDKF
jgi:hypothetical protein